MCKVLVQLNQNCRRSSRDKITSILYTDRHTDEYEDRHMDGEMDRQADSSIPKTTFVLWGYNKTAYIHKPSLVLRTTVMLFSNWPKMFSIPAKTNINSETHFFCCLQML